MQWQISKRVLFKTSILRVSLYILIYFIGKVSVPHNHVIKDLMKPDDHVAHEAIWNPQLITKTFRLEPKM